MNILKNKTAIIGTVGVPASYGGFETLVENLIEDNTISFDVYCSSKHYPIKIKKYKNANLIYIPLNANGVSSIIYDITSILHATFIKKNSNILILGVSGCIILPVIRCFSRTRIITNIDGLEWRRDKWGFLAKKFLKISEYFAVKFSHTIISDNKAIEEYVFKEYNIESYVIAYGGDHALQKKAIEKKDENLHIKNDFSLSLCRIEPENNVHLILDAFSNSNHKLKFIGNWNNSDYGRKLKIKYSNFENIEILDPIYDVETLNKYRSNCILYIHGHSAGGTNPSLVEMMFFSKPILCFDCQYNRHTTDNMASYFKDASHIIELINRKNELFQQGIDMKNIADKKYKWENIRIQYSNILKSEVIK